MSIRALSTPRQSVFAVNHRAVMFSLEALLKVQVDCSELFEELFFTTGNGKPLTSFRASMLHKPELPLAA
ncbi:hypothetical protein NLA06_14815 [Desulfomicrobium sp. ZS1]|uniref:hypothetical protein n=1 Tax=Desulfomicrobium sp. ZS1 TaxID=2952228 RepID=UPI0020B3179C|nr:hypothetical protein [Desulfomicrobium sp. ZS1]UTF49814.1 hypothetical protein NLA06_14815 [Desulfomicrobium sp. ZS1]